MEYKIFRSERPSCAEAIDELAEIIDEACTTGFMPLGGVSITFCKLPITHAGSDFYTAAQAMVRT